MRRLCLVCLCALGVACDSESGGSSHGDSGTSGDPTSSGDSGPIATTSGIGETSSTDAPGSSGSSGGESTTSGGPQTTTDSGQESSGGSEDTGAVLPRGQWAMTEITYTEGGQSETLTMQDRAFCDATLGSGTLQLRYQQQQGYTVWLLNIPEGSASGSHPLTQDFSGVYMNINEVSDAWQAYFDPSMAVGTLTLTDADIQPGGVVAGTLTAELTSVDGDTNAAFESTFYAEIP